MRPQYCRGTSKEQEKHNKKNKCHNFVDNILKNTKLHALTKIRISNIMFLYKCKGAIQELWHKIVLEFFTTSSDKPTYEMDIEAYSEGVMSDSDYHSEIWIPVVKKETSAACVLRAAFLR